MARYFFHLCDPAETLRDPEGVDVADRDALPAYVLRQARSILSHEVLEGAINLEQWIEVADEGNGIVHRLHFADALTIRGSVSRGRR